MTVSKRVAKSGAVTLPRQLRQETGILPGVPVDILDSRINMTRLVPQLRVLHKSQPA